MSRTHSIILLIIVILLVFGAAYNYEFVCWDDDINIVNNQYINPPSIKSIFRFWEKSYKYLYIPVTYNFWLLLSFIGQLYTVKPLTPSLSPQPFHVANLILHTLNAILVYVIILHILKSQKELLKNHLIQRAALIGALIFALHPVQVEPVCWVTGMKDLLFSLFSLVAIWQYMIYLEQYPGSKGKKVRQNKRYILHYGYATAAFLLAILSKPTGIVVLIIAWIIDQWIYNRSMRESILPLCLWGIAALPIIIYTKYLQPERLMDFVAPIWARPFIAADALAFYLYKLLVPIRIGPDYGRAPDFVLQRPWLYVVWIIPTALVISLWLLRNRYRIMLVAVGIFIGALVPVLGLVPFGFQTYSTVADRFLYLPMLGTALACAWLFSVQKRKGWVVVCVVIIILLGIRSRLQARYWRDSKSLCALAVKVNPASSGWHNNLGLLLFRDGEIDAALTHYIQALKVRPDDVEVHNNLGNALAAKERFDEAIKHYSRAVELDPNHAAGFNNMGVAYDKQGDIEKAMEYYGKAIKLDPNYAAAYNNLGLAKVKLGRLEDAVKDYVRAIELIPNNVTFNCNIGNVFYRLGNIEKAKGYYRKALQCNPEYDEARLRLEMMAVHDQRSEANPQEIEIENIFREIAESLESEGKLSEAITYYTKALEVEPNNVDIHNNIAILNAKMGETTAAITHFKKSLKLDPQNADVLNNLGNCFFLQGDIIEAKKYYEQALKIDPNHSQAKLNLNRVF